MYGQKQISISEFFDAPINYQELIRGYYGLNYREFVVLCSLNQLGQADTDQISEKIDDGWPKNKINSALKKLVDLDLCHRKKVVPEDQKRGYRYVYSSISPEKISENIIFAFEKFLVSAKNELEDLGYHLNSVDTKAYKRKKMKKEKIREEWFDENS